MTFEIILYIILQKEIAIKKETKLSTFAIRERKVKLKAGRTIFYLHRVNEKDLRVLHPLTVNLEYMQSQ